VSHSDPRAAILLTSKTHQELGLVAGKLTSMIAAMFVTIGNSYNDI